MRLLENVRVPDIDPFANIPGYQVQFLSNVNVGNAADPPTRFFLPVPRLGREWQVDRISVNATVQEPIYSGTGNPVVVMTANLALNGMVISDPKTFSMNLVPWTSSVPTPVQFPADTVEPTIGLEVRSGDQLSVDNVQFTISGMSASPAAAGIYIRFQFSVYGSNDPATVTRQ